MDLQSHFTSCFPWITFWISTVFVLHHLTFLVCMIRFLCWQCLTGSSKLTRDAASWSQLKHWEPEERVLNVISSVLPQTQSSVNKLSVDLYIIISRLGTCSHSASLEKPAFCFEHSSLSLRRPKFRNWYLECLQENGQSVIIMLHWINGCSPAFLLDTILLGILFCNYHPFSLYWRCFFLVEWKWGGRSETYSKCIVLLPYAHFHCPVENPAFPRWYYELPHGTPVAGFTGLVTERSQTRLMQAHRAVSWVGVNIPGHWHGLERISCQINKYFR